MVSVHRAVERWHVNRFQLLVLALRAQVAYQIWLERKRKARHNSKRVTLRTHRGGVPCLS
jgi:hypothetical protein